MRCVSLLRRSRRAIGARRGVAATEMALVAPIMILLYYGTIEITQSVIAKRKLNIVAMTMGDLASRVTTIGSSDASDIFGTAAAIMAPINASAMQLRLSSVIIEPNNVVCVDWSVGRNIAALAPGSSIAVPASITATPSTTARAYILAEAAIAFRPTTSQIIRNTIQLKEGPTYLVPRQSDRVVADSTIQASSPCA